MASTTEHSRRSIHKVAKVTAGIAAARPVSQEPATVAAMMGMAAARKTGRTIQPAETTLRSAIFIAEMISRNLAGSFEN